MAQYWIAVALMSAILPRASTFSKGPEFWGGKAFTPRTLCAGDGAFVYNAYDWREYLDWVSSLGANLLGHADSEFTRKIVQRLHQGTSFSLPHYLEQVVAEQLVAVLGAHVPGWAPDGLSVRFGLSGSDACSMAVRLARAVTGRPHIVMIGYHGWGSEFIAGTPPAWGVEPQPVTNVPFGYKFEPGANEVACVIIEQPCQVAPPDYWAHVQDFCHATGALLIMDEVVTGLRFGLGGAAGYHGIHPDIVCMGKALGNGIPISACVFPREMGAWFARRDPVFVSSTHFGCTLGLAAANHILSRWTQADVDHLWSIGQHLTDGLRDIGYTVDGYAPDALIKDTPARRAYFITGMRDRGILCNRPNIPNRAHTLEDVTRTLRAAFEVWSEMQTVDVEAAVGDNLPETLFANR